MEHDFRQQKTGSAGFQKEAALPVFCCFQSVRISRTDWMDRRACVRSSFC